MSAVLVPRRFAQANVAATGKHASALWEVRHAATPSAIVVQYAVVWMRRIAWRVHVAQIRMQLRVGFVAWMVRSTRTVFVARMKSIVKVRAAWERAVLWDVQRRRVPEELHA
jgi:uncharacterized membrane protein